MVPALGVVVVCDSKTMDKDRYKISDNISFVPLLLKLGRGS